jgi:hypothetical protein
MADIQGELARQELRGIETAAKKGGWKLVCVMYNSLPRFPQDVAETFLRMTKDKPKQGKQSMKSLMGSGASIENIEINSSNIGDFKSTARAFGVDYSLKKITTPQDGGDKVQYAVFFKSKNANVMQSAMQEYAKRVAKRQRNPTLMDRLKANIKRTQEQSRNRERSRQKTKTRGQER